MSQVDVLVIGGGLNGLVTAAVLAKRKRAVTLLERHPVVGGAASTSELAPGLHGPALSHAVGPVHRDVLRALELESVAGLEFLTPDPALTALAVDGRLVSFHRDPVLTAASLHRVSAHDATVWRDFQQTMHRIAGVLAALDRRPPPAIDHASVRDWLSLLGAGRRARALGRRDLARLARWMPMAVADLVDEWFEADLVQAAVAARALVGTFAGPRSAGTGAALLQRIAEDPMPVGSGVTTRGGPGALARAVAARAESYGAVIRTAARVTRIVSRNGRASGVVLEDGTELTARLVVSAIHPRETLLELVDPMDLPAAFRERMRHLRSRGLTAKINLALSALPEFPAFAGDSLPLRGRLLIGPRLDYLERAFDAAKYGAISDEPWLEVAIPSVLDPSLTPAGGHVMSIYAQCAPAQLRDGSWEDGRETLYRRVLNVLAPHAPTLETLITAREIITTADLEAHWGMTGGHLFHGELALDQSWVARPLLGWSRYATPLDGLFLASAGTHPGGGLTGLPGLHAARFVETELARVDRVRPRV
jgi:phytoene dehydrogenase-like protein